MVGAPLGDGFRGTGAVPGAEEAADAAGALYAGKRLGGGTGGPEGDDVEGPPAPGNGLKSAPTATEGTLGAGGADEEEATAPGKRGGRAAGGAAGGAAGAGGMGAPEVEGGGGRGGIP